MCFFYVCVCVRAWRRLQKEPPGGHAFAYRLRTVRALCIFLSPPLRCRDRLVVLRGLLSALVASMLDITCMVGDVRLEGLKGLCLSDVHVVRDMVV